MLADAQKTKCPQCGERAELAMDIINENPHGTRVALKATIKCDANGHMLVYKFDGGVLTYGGKVSVRGDQCGSSTH